MDVAAAVLVVDDNFENRALACDCLEEAGYRVVAVKGGRDGLEAFARQDIDCVLLDVRMPDMDGFTACAHIRALPGGTGVPVIFVTALRNVEAFDEAVRAGGDDFITKPYRPTELVARVAAAVKLRRLASERNELYEHVKRQRDDLKRMQLQKEQLIAFVVHDLKNPVNSIEVAAQIAARVPDLPDVLRRNLGRIRQESQTLLRMLTNLLDLAKADEVGIALAIGDVDLADLTADVVAALQPRSQAMGVRVAAQVAATVRADPSLMRRVLENLVDNALRYAPEGSEIQLRSHPRDRGVELRVIDRGPGVPPALREHIFERFVRGDTDAARTNYGLGLAFCKLVVEEHGGRIWIDDASPGAAFCIWLPAPST